MEKHPEQVLLEKSMSHNKTGRLIFGVGSGVGAILCLAGTATHEEMLAYIGLGKYFILGGIGFAYHIGLSETQTEIKKRFSAR